MDWYTENGKHLGFIDGTFLYLVAYEDGSWYWEYVPDMDGFDGYDTAEEAMADAEIDAHENGFITFTAKKPEQDEEEEGYTTEEMDEILGDLLYDERKEEGLF